MAAGAIGPEEPRGVVASLADHSEYPLTQRCNVDTPCGEHVGKRGTCLVEQHHDEVSGPGRLPAIRHPLQCCGYGLDCKGVEGNAETRAQRRDVVDLPSACRKSGRLSEPRGKRRGQLPSRGQRLGALDGCDEQVPGRDHSAVPGQDGGSSNQLVIEASRNPAVGTAPS